MAPSARIAVFSAEHFRKRCAHDTTLIEVQSHDSNINYMSHALDTSYRATGHAARRKLLASDAATRYAMVRTTACRQCACRTPLRIAPQPPNLQLLNEPVQENH
jgi:hypothetical protein